MRRSPFGRVEARLCDRFEIHVSAGVLVFYNGVNRLGEQCGLQVFFCEGSAVEIARSADTRRFGRLDEYNRYFKVILYVCKVIDCF